MIAAVLMAVSALTSVLIRTDERECELVEEASSKMHEQMDGVLPVQGEVIQEYGPNYAEEYHQWEMCEEVTFRSKEETVISPIPGMIEKIEALADGGSCITIRTDQVSVQLYPVYQVCVFEGSVVERGTRLGEASDQLSMRAEKDGLPVDPVKIDQMVF